MLGYLQPLILGCNWAMPSNFTILSSSFRLSYRKNSSELKFRDSAQDFKPALPIQGSFSLCQCCVAFVVISVLYSVMHDEM
jgi:hypothetical protein